MNFDGFKPPEENEADDKSTVKSREFERFLDESGVNLAFQTIFAEILSKRIEPANVFSYASMRLKDIGKEIAYMLPQAPPNRAEDS